MPDQVSDIYTHDYTSAESYVSLWFKKGDPRVRAVVHGGPYSRDMKVWFTLYVSPMDDSTNHAYGFATRKVVSDFLEHNLDNPKAQKAWQEMNGFPWKD